MEFIIIIMIMIVNTILYLIILKKIKFLYHHGLKGVKSIKIQKAYLGLVKGLKTYLRQIVKKYIQLV